MPQRGQQLPLRIDLDAPRNKYLFAHFPAPVESAPLNARGTACHLSTPNLGANASSASLSASREATAKSPRIPAVDQPTTHFRPNPRPPKAVNVEVALLPVMY